MAKRTQLWNVWVFAHGGWRKVRREPCSHSEGDTIARELSARGHLAVLLHDGERPGMRQRTDAP